MPTAEPFVRKYIIDHSQARRALDDIRRREAEVVRSSEQGYGRQRDALGRYVSQGERGHARVGRAGASAARSIGLAFRRWVTGVAVAALSAVLGVLGKATTEAAKFNLKLAEIGTLGDNSSATMKRFEKGIIDIAARVGGGTFQEFLSALYDIRSAGYDGAAGLIVLEQAARTAVAGVTDVSTAADLITTTLNAYNLSASESQKVSDLLFTTVQQGKTTIPELASSLGKVLPAANAAGVSLEEVLAAVATLTASGLSTAESVTRTAGAIRGIVKPTDQAKEAAKSMGVELGAAALLSKGLVGVMADVQRATGGSADKMSQLFTDTEGYEAAIQLAGNQSERFTQNLEGMNVSMGASVEAFRQMNEQTEQLEDRLRNKLQGIFLELGQKTIPLYNKALETALQLTQTFDAPADRLLATLKNLDGVDPTIIAELEIKVNQRQLLEEQREAQRILRGAEVSFLAPNERDLARKHGISQSIAGQSRQYKAEDLDDVELAKLRDNIIDSLELINQDIDAEEGFLKRVASNRLVNLYEQQLDQITKVEVARARLKAATEGLAQSEERLQNIHTQSPPTASGTPTPTGGGGGSVDPEELERAQKALKAIEEASTLAGAVTKDQRKALQDIFHIKDQIATLDEHAALIGQEAYDAQRAILDERLAKAQAQLKKETAIAEAITRATTEVNKLAARPADIPSLLGIDSEDAIQRVTSALQDYQRIATELGNQRSSGDLTEEAYFDQSAAAADAFLDRLASLKESLGALLGQTPELEKRFREAFDEGEKGAKDATKSTEEGKKKLKEYNNTLGDTASAIRSIEGLLNVFGDLDDTMSNLLRSSADVLQNIQNIGDARRAFEDGTLGQQGLSAATALGGIGIAAGIASAIVPLIKSFRDRKDQSHKEIAATRQQTEAAEELALTIREAGRAFRDSISRLRESAIVGGDVTRTELTSASALLDNLERLGIGEDEARRHLEALEHLLGIEGLVGQFDSALEGGATVREAINLFLSALRATTEGIKENFGSFGDSMQGLVALLEFMKEKLGATSEDLRSVLISEFERTGLSVELRNRILDELKNLDLNDPEAVAAFFQGLRQGFLDGDLASLLGDSTPEEFLDFLDFLERLFAADPTATSGTDGVRTSQSVQFIRQATEVQVNVMIDLLREIAHWVRVQATRVPSVPGIDGYGIRNPADYLPAIPTPRLSSGQGDLNITIPIGNIEYVRAFTDTEIDQMKEAFEMSLRRLGKTAIRKHKSF